jgi:hypothetical protein
MRCERRVFERALALLTEHARNGWATAAVALARELRSQENEKEDALDQELADLIKTKRTRPIARRLAVRYGAGIPIALMPASSLATVPANDAQFIVIGVRPAEDVVRGLHAQTAFYRRRMVVTTSSSRSRR